MVSRDYGPGDCHVSSSFPEAVSPFRFDFSFACMVRIFSLCSRVDCFRAFLWDTAGGPPDGGPVATRGRLEKKKRKEKKR